MTDAEQFMAWAPGHYSDWARKPARRELLLRMTQDALSKIEPGEQVGTTELYRRIWGCDPTTNPQHNKCMGYFVNGLGFLRKQGLLNGCFTQDDKPTPRSYGHKRIWWINPVATTGLEHLL